MNEKILHAINYTYYLLEKLENKEKNESSIELLDSCAIIYYSENMKKYFINFVNKDDYSKDYKSLSDITKNEFISFVKVLSDDYLIIDKW